MLLTTFSLKVIRARLSSLIYEEGHVCGGVGVQ